MHEKKINISYLSNYTSIRKYQAEIISMVVNMLHGTVECCGCVTTGGTESILMSMKAYRDLARCRGKIGKLNILAPDTIHLAFSKAAQ